MSEVQVKQEPEWTNDERPAELVRVDVKEEVRYEVEVEIKSESAEQPDALEDWEKMPGTPKVSPRQWAYLLAFMEAHKEFAKGSSKNVTPRAKRSAAELWEKLAAGINNLGSGIYKSPAQWREYWKNKRYEVRKKLSNQRKEAYEMGRQALPASMYMSAKDERILAILGKDAILPGSEPIDMLSKLDTDDPITIANYPSRVSPVPQPQPPPTLPPPLPPVSPPPPPPAAATSPSRSTPSPTPVSSERGRSVCLSPSRRIPIKRPGYHRAPQPLEWSRLMDERRLKMSMRKVRALENLANSYSAVATAVQTLTQTSKTTATAMQAILKEMTTMRETVQQAVRTTGQNRDRDSRMQPESVFIVKQERTGSQEM